MSKKCSQCQYPIVWKFVQPLRNEYACRRCGFSWSIKMNEVSCRFGVYLGNWTPETVAVLEANLINFSSSKLGNDWNIFRGKTLYTAWRDSDKDKMIAVKKIDELVYWIGLACTDNKWFAQYTKTYSKTLPKVPPTSKTLLRLNGDTSAFSSNLY